MADLKVAVSLYYIGLENPVRIDLPRDQVEMLVNRFRDWLNRPQDAASVTVGIEMETAHIIRLDQVRQITYVAQKRPSAYITNG
jgi:hypothetical protein